MCVCERESEWCVGVGVCRETDKNNRAIVATRQVSHHSRMGRLIKHGVYRLQDAHEYTHTQADKLGYERVVMSYSRSGFDRTPRFSQM